MQEHAVAVDGVASKRVFPKAGLQAHTFWGRQGWIRRRRQGTGGRYVWKGLSA